MSSKAIWHYVKNGQAVGPVTAELLRQMLASGAVKPADLVWREGLANWVPVSSVPDFRARPAAAPAVPAAPRSAPAAAAPVSRPAPSARTSAAPAPARVKAAEPAPDTNELETELSAGAAKSSGADDLDLLGSLESNEAATPVAAAADWPAATVVQSPAAANSAGMLQSSASGASTTAATPKSWRDRVWIVALVICAGVLFWARLSLTTDVYPLAVIVIVSVILAVLPWAIFHGVILGLKLSHRSAISYGLIAAALITGTFIASSRNRTEQVASFDKMEKALIKVQKNFQGEKLADESPATETSTPDPVPAPAPAPAPSSSALSPSSPPMSDVARFDKAVAENMDRMAAFQREYMQSVQASGWPGILSAERLQRDQDLSESRALIAKVNQLIDTYEKKQLAMLLQFRAEVENSPISASAKAGFLRGMDKKMPEARETLAASWQLEKDIVGKFGAIIDLLAQSKNWTIRNNQLLFESNADIEAFNALIQQVQELVAKQQQMAQEKVSKGLRDIDAQRKRLQTH